MAKYTEYVKCLFTDEEITAAARDLARSTQKRASIEQRKKEVDAALKGEIEAEISVIGRLSTYINTGYEYRDVECRVELDTPVAGKKRIVRLDTEEEVKIIQMTDDDKQMALDLSDKADGEPKPIVTDPPEIRRIEAPAECTVTDGDGNVIFEGTTDELRQAGEVPTPFEADTHRKSRRARDRAAEGVADGSA
jgi:hypothetical protein